MITAKRIVDQRKFHCKQNKHIQAKYNKTNNKNQIEMHAIERKTGFVCFYCDLFLFVVVKKCVRFAPNVDVKRSHRVGCSLVNKIWEIILLKDLTQSDGKQNRRELIDSDTTETN